MDPMILAVSAAALIVGVVGGMMVSARRTEAQLKRAATEEAKRAEAADRAHEEALDAVREEVNQDQAAAEQDLKQRIAETKGKRDELRALESDLKEARGTVEKEREKAVSQQAQAEGRAKNLEAQKARLEQEQKGLQEALERVAGLTQDEARERLEQQLQSAAEERVAAEVRRMQQAAIEDARAESRKVLAKAVYRFGGEVIGELTTTAVNLPSDEVKGRIIGREGRNIQAFEQATGVDVIIDDTPELITLSCFNPVRREVARVALERLIADGRIHPTRIEGAVAKAESGIEKVLRQTGDDAAAMLGIHGVNPALLGLIGRLKLHQVGAQNQLTLALATAKLAELIATELGVNPKACRRAGLLALIGRAADHQLEGSAAEVAAGLVRKHGESKAVIAALDDLASDGDPQSTMGVVLASAMRLAQSRPGAQHEALALAIERLTEVETMVAEEEGVRAVHVVQAGSEVRVLVDPGEVAESKMLAMAQRMARRIEDRADAMGEVRVHVIRETRVTETAM
jgi:ribonucrease Y